MGERIDQLASTFEKSCGDFTTLVEGLNDAQWRTAVPSEMRTVGIVAHHVAGGIVQTIQAMTMIASGQGFPATKEMLDQGAAEHIRTHANVSKAETVALLRENAKVGAGMIRSMTDEQLDKAGPVALMGGQMVPAGHFAQGVVIGHLSDHTASIKAALGT